MGALKEALGSMSDSERIETYAEAFKLEIADVFREVLDGKIDKKNARDKIIKMVDIQLGNL